MSKLQIYFLTASSGVWIYFQRVKIPYARGETAETLASRKVASREAYTEGSETAKSGTDEQKRDMRHFWTGEQAQLCDAQRIQKSRDVDSAGIGRRKMFLPGEILE